MVWNITRNDSDDGQKYGIPTKRLTGYVQLSFCQYAERVK